MWHIFNPSCLSEKVFIVCIFFFTSIQPSSFGVSVCCHFLVIGLVLVLGMCEFVFEACKSDVYWLMNALNSFQPQDFIQALVFLLPRKRWQTDGRTQRTCSALSEPQLLQHLVSWVVSCAEVTSCLYIAHSCKHNPFTHSKVGSTYRSHNEIIKACWNPSPDLRWRRRSPTALLKTKY